MTLSICRGYSPSCMAKEIQGDLAHYRHPWGCAPNKEWEQAAQSQAGPVQKGLCHCEHSSLPTLSQISSSVHRACLPIDGFV